MIINKDPTNAHAVEIAFDGSQQGATVQFAGPVKMVTFGAANLVILLVVMAVKRYAFTSVWCAYAAIASVIVLIYFWRSSETRPLLYGQSSWGV